MQSNSHALHHVLDAVWGRAVLQHPGVDGAVRRHTIGTPTQHWLPIAALAACPIDGALAIGDAAHTVLLAKLAPRDDAIATLVQTVPQSAPGVS